MTCRQFNCLSAIPCFNMAHWLYLDAWYLQVCWWCLSVLDVLGYPKIPQGCYAYHGVWILDDIPWVPRVLRDLPCERRICSTTDISRQQYPRVIRRFVILHDTQGVLHTSWTEDMLGYANICDVTVVRSPGHSSRPPHKWLGRGPEAGALMTWRLVCRIWIRRKKITTITVRNVLFVLNKMICGRRNYSIDWII